jgi:hypothetical protein
MQISCRSIVCTSICIIVLITAKLVVEIKLIKELNNLVKSLEQKIQRIHDNGEVIAAKESITSLAPELSEFENRTGRQEDNTSNPKDAGEETTSTQKVTVIPASKTNQVTTPDNKNNKVITSTPQRTAPKTNQQATEGPENKNVKDNSTTNKQHLHGLTNYWPVKNGQMADVIGHVETRRDESQFTADRFGNENDAFIGEWMIPGGSYFNKDFTVTAWVKKLNCNWNTIGLSCSFSSSFLFHFSNSIFNFKFGVITIVLVKLF